MAKLLIVDDEPITVEMLETFLQINGFETMGAFTGEDGLVLLRIEHPEIIILDLMLPDIEGYEVCRRLRNQPDTANIPVLILSARAESASRERALAAGADAYLTKPVKFGELLIEIQRLAIEGHVSKTVPATQPAAPTEVPPTPIVITVQSLDSATPAASAASALIVPPADQPGNKPAEPPHADSPANHPLENPGN